MNTSRYFSGGYLWVKGSGLFALNDQKDHWKLNVIAGLRWTSVLEPWICLRWFFFYGFYHCNSLLKHHFGEYVLVIFFQPLNFSKSKEQTAPNSLWNEFLWFDRQDLHSHQAASRHLKHVTGISLNTFTLRIQDYPEISGGWDWIPS